MKNRKKVLIIAEAGVNHNGSIELAKNMVDVAYKAGVDIIKFQTGTPELIISKNALKAEYQSKTTGANESQLEMIKKIILPLESYREIMEYCEIVGIKFLSTPFDLPSVDFLDELGINIFKIPSGEITNLPYLEKIASFNKEIIISTGMCNLGEIEQALSIITSNGTPLDKITVLHCNTEYPTPFSDVNLRAMHTIKKSFGVKVGYSDHTKGIEVSIAAVAMGADVIEKHFTLDRNMEGPDHSSSLEPKELEMMVKNIRNIEEALGDGIKKMTSSESKNREVARKSIHLLRSFKKGHILSFDDLIMKRPGNGISPMLINSVIGKRIVRDMTNDDILFWKDLK